jgi:serine/threonine protein kinase
MVEQNSEITIETLPNGSDTAHIEPGFLIDEKYKVLEPIGSGGMGTIYRVEQVFLGKEFALKLLNSNRLTDRETRRFHLEAKMTAQLQHPNLVEVRDFGVFNNQKPYLVMDIINGISLSEHLKVIGSMPVIEALPIVIQVGFGLLYAHEKGVVHRDIKPANIVLTNSSERAKEGTVKVVDFGIAKLLQSEDGEIQSLTRTGEIFGSPIYMSPEQCRGGFVDHTSDIYSLGCVLFHMLTGAPPFLEDTALATMMARLAERAPTLKEGSIGQEFPQELEQVVAKMLAIDPKQRHQSLAEVITDLAAIENDKSCASDARMVSDSHRKSISFRKWNGVMRALGGAMLGALVIFGINSWSETGQLKTPAKRSVQGNTTQNRPDKIYPYAEVFMDSDGNPIRRFHFDDCPDLGFISWQGRTFKTNRTVEIRSLEPVAFTLVDQSMASDRNLLSKFSGIEFNSLDLSDNKHVDSDTIQPLFRFTNLETINLNHTSVSAIKSLSRLPKLKDLWVLGTNVSTEGILNVSRLLELESLRFGPVENPTRIITRLQGSNNLVSLHIKGPGIDAGSVSQIAKLRNLKELELRDCPEIKDSALSGLTRCIKLQTLIIRDCAITAKSMETFKRILPLRKLSITADGWSDKERAHLIKAFPYASIVISKGGKRIKRENALQHFLEIE